MELERQFMVTISYKTSSEYHVTEQCGVKFKILHRAANIHCCIIRKNWNGYVNPTEALDVSGIFVMYKEGMSFPVVGTGRFPSAQAHIRVRIRKYAYVANLSNDTMAIFVFHPTSPFQVGTTTPTGANPNAVFVSVGMRPQPIRNIPFVDTQSSSPIEVGNGQTSPSPNGVFVSGKYAQLLLQQRCHVGD